MARQRDYKAEYAQRLRREQEKAATEGREFSRQKARGHVSREHESELRKTRAERPVNRLRYWESRTRFNVSPDEYRVIVDSAVARSGEDTVIEILRRKYASARDFMARVNDGMEYAVGSDAANSPAANGSKGQGAYYDFQKRYAYLPVELFWYHGYY